MLTRVAVALLLAFVAVSVAFVVPKNGEDAKPLEEADCGFPNGTDVHYVWWNCFDQFIHFNNATPLNADGSLDYPLDLTKPVNVKAEIMNNGKTYNKILLSLSVWEWGSTLGKCGWSSVPTFGLLDNMDGCAKGIPCPVQPGGPQDLTATIDFTPFKQIISLLKDGGAYQVQAIFKDSASSDHSCLMLQGKAKTK